MIVHWSSLTHNSPGVTAANSGTTTARNTNNRTGPAALLATPHSLSNPDCRQHGCCCRHEPLEPSRDTVVQCNSTRLAWCSCCCCGVKYSTKFSDVFFLLFATNNESNKIPITKCCPVSPHYSPVLEPAVSYQRGNQPWITPPSTAEAHLFSTFEQYFLSL